MGLSSLAEKLRLGRSDRSKKPGSSLIGARGISPISKAPAKLIYFSTICHSTLR